jgi:hypothetical protein
MVAVGDDQGLENPVFLDGSGEFGEFGRVEIGARLTGIGVDGSDRDFRHAG